MHFKEWLIQIGKSPKTADNYSRAVLGAISNWANDAGLCIDSLDKIHSIAELVKIEDGIKPFPSIRKEMSLAKTCTVVH
jgi:hypothetical protein